MVSFPLHAGHPVDKRQANASSQGDGKLTDSVTNGMIFSSNLNARVLPDRFITSANRTFVKTWGFFSSSRTTQRSRYRTILVEILLSHEPPVRTGHNVARGCPLILVCVWLVTSTAIRLVVASFISWPARSLVMFHRRFMSHWVWDRSVMLDCAKRARSSVGLGR